MGIIMQNKRLNSDHKHPDIIIFNRCGGFNGFAIEMKDASKEAFIIRITGLSVEEKQKILKTILKKESERQRVIAQGDMLKWFLDQGYFASFACGSDEAKAIISIYFSLDIVPEKEKSRLLGFLDSTLDKYSLNKA
jgi:hypothetical protein